jgi:DNA invertase Pin-like site-specific DNA recombinase
VHAEVSQPDLPLAEVRRRFAALTKSPSSRRGPLARAAKAALKAERLRALVQQGMPTAEAARELDIGRSTAFRLIGRRGRLK